MLSRRQLFTRLSAIALAPLVKLLPKQERLYMTPSRVCYYDGSMRLVSQGEAEYLHRNGVEYECLVEIGALPDPRKMFPVPQEEA